MATKKYVSYDNLVEYNALVKEKIDNGDANTLSSAKSYTDGKVANLSSTASVDSKISSHNTSTTAHNDIRNLITALSTKVNNFLDVDDETTDQLSEVLALINNNKGTLESITTSKINVSDIVNDLTTNSTNKVLSAAQGVVIKGLIDALQTELGSHTHTIANVTGLQSALDGKAATSHGTHVTYSTTAPLMDGTANAGTASTVARSDHKHPVDTSRAAKTDLDSHTGNTTVHITAAERTNWNSAKTHADTAHAPSNAEKNQNAFSNVKVGTTTASASSATDTLTLVNGDNITIALDTTNKKATISAKDTTYTHPNSGVTAGTYRSVTVNAQGHVTGGSNPTTLAGYGITDAATKSHTHTADSALSSTSTNPVQNKVIATTVDDINSSIASLKETKANVTHIHDIATNTSDGFMSTEDKQKINLLTGKNYQIGSITGKTINDLRNSLDNWLNSSKSTYNASTYFVASSDWITYWNENDTSSVISSGVLWTVRISGIYTTKDYAQLEISTYGDKDVYYCTRRNGTWYQLRKVTFNDDLNQMNKEAYLSWGGKNFSGTYGCIDAAMIPELGANRLAFGNASGITIEYSRDSGNTWEDYGLSDNQKKGVFGTGYGCIIGKADDSNKATKDYMLRVTINTIKFGVYSILNKFAIYISTNGCNGCYCTIDAATNASPTNFVNFGDKISISGWSGWNIINTSGITTYGNTSSQYQFIRFTFGCASCSTSYVGLNIMRIMGFGGVGWSTPSNMAKYGTIYSYDNSQNVTFPAQVTANSFKGSLDGNASTATALTSSNGSSVQPIYFSNGKPVATSYSLNKTVPSDAKFTDTTYDEATTSMSGLMSKSDKTKLDSIASGANNYTLPTASSSTLGGVKTTSSVTSSSGYTACPIISGVPYFKNTTYSLSSFGLTATATELNYCDGVTSNIQTQINNMKHKTFTVTFSKNGFGSLISYPSGFDSSNCYVAAVLVHFNDTWRTGSGCISANDRCFAQITPAGIQPYLYAYSDFDTDDTTIDIKIIIKKFD